MKKINFSWVIIIGIAIIIPIILNSIILFPSVWPVVGGPNAGTVWLSFWSTYLGSIASFAMVYCTWRTLRQNKEQLEEMRRQWNEEHKPDIDIIPVYLKALSMVVLEIRNVSNSYAKDIQFRIDPQYINQIPCLSNSDRGVKNFYNTICEYPFTLLPNECKRFYLITKNLWELEDSHFVMILNERYSKEQYEIIFNYLKLHPIKIDCWYNNAFHKSFLIDIKDAFLGDIQIE